MLSAWLAALTPLLTNLPPVAAQPAKGTHAAPESAAFVLSSLAK